MLPTLPLLALAALTAAQSATLSGSDNSAASPPATSSSSASSSASPGQASGAGTATQTISLFLLDHDPFPIKGSVIAYAAPSTTLLLGCATLAATLEEEQEEQDVRCGLPGSGETVTVATGAGGTTTIEARMSNELGGSGFSASWRCEVVSGGADCALSFGGGVTIESGTGDERYTTKVTGVQLIPATVTGGLEKLSATGGASASANGSASASAVASQTGVAAKRGVELGVGVLAGLGVMVGF